MSTKIAGLACLQNKFYTTLCLNDVISKILVIRDQYCCKRPCERRSCARLFSRTLSILSKEKEKTDSRQCNFKHTFKNYLILGIVISKALSETLILGSVISKLLSETFFCLLGTLEYLFISSIH